MNEEPVMLQPMKGELAKKFNLYLNLRGKGELSLKALCQLSPQEIQYVIESPSLSDYVL